MFIILLGNYLSILDCCVIIVQECHQRYSDIVREANYFSYYELLLQEEVVFRYFVLDSSVILGVLEEPFVDDSMTPVCRQYLELF